MSNPPRKKPVMAFFNQIMPGDFKKQRKQSNTVDSGGGARDLRLPARYAELLLPFFSEKVAPKQETPTDSHPQIRKSVVHWGSGSSEESVEVLLHPPTASRPGEYRIARIYTIASWQIDEAAFSKASEAGEIWFYYFGIDQDGRLWAGVYEQQHWQSSKTSKAVRDYLQARITARKGDQAVRGFMNFQAKETMMTEFVAPSAQALEVLRLLRDYHNVLLAGPPASGKSRLLAEVRHWFRVGEPQGSGAGNGVTSFAPSDPVAFPGEEAVETFTPADWTPSPDRMARQTFDITFHQGTKYRDFIGGLVPETQKDKGTFRVVHGPLYEATQHALQSEGAALVVVDEINRGPAIAVFGDTITAIERDKRLAPDGTEGPLTAHFRTLNANGDPVSLALPHHVYLLGAMNEADTSVEPLDVAFRRRWQLYRLMPDAALLRQFLQLPAQATALPEQATSATELYEAAVQAWARVNERIELGRGAELQIGHGIFMDRDVAPQEFAGSQDFVIEGWKRIFSHAAEVFFGDVRGLAFVVGTGDKRPYQLQERLFADNPVPLLKQPALTPQNIYSILRAAAGEA